MFRDKLRVGFHWQSIETGSTGLGIPDSNFCCDGIEGWVEFKQTEGWAVGLTTEQIGWHMTRARRGGSTFVAVRRKHGGGPRKGPPADQLWLYGGDSASDLGRAGLNDTSVPWLGMWDGGPAAWDWDHVRRLLLSQ